MSTEEPVGARAGLFPSMDNVNRAADAIARLCDKATAVLTQVQEGGLTITTPGVTVTIKTGDA